MSPGNHQGPNKAINLLPVLSRSTSPSPKWPQIHSSHGNTDTRILKHLLPRTQIYSCSEVPTHRHITETYACYYLLSKLSSHPIKNSVYSPSSYEALFECVFNSSPLPVYKQVLLPFYLNWLKHISILISHIKSGTNPEEVTHITHQVCAMSSFLYTTQWALIKKMTWLIPYYCHISLQLSSGTAQVSVCCTKRVEAKLVYFNKATQSALCQTQEFRIKVEDETC